MTMKSRNRPLAMLVALVMSAATLAGTMAMLTVGAEPPVNLVAAVEGNHRPA